MVTDMSSSEKLLLTEDNQFPKIRRILTGPEFLFVFRHSERSVYRHGPILMVCLVKPSGQSRLGLVVARRCIRSSVQRNRFKRVARERFRLSASKHASVDVIVRVVTPLQNKHWRSLHDIFLKLYQSIER